MAYITNKIKQSEGSTIFINDGYKLIDYELQGDTVQDGTPTPDSPVEIETVSGRQVIDIVGKNLWKGFNYSRTNSDVLFTHNEDGSISASGTASSNCFSIQNSTVSSNGWYINLQAGTYTLSGGINDTKRLDIINSEGEAVAIDTGQSTTFTLTETNKVYIRARILQGTEVDDTFYPQIEVGSIASEYEEHKEQSYEIWLDNNLFDKTDYRNNSRINSTGGNYAENGYFTSRYIKVKPNTIYVKNSPTEDGYHRVAFYTGTTTDTFISKSESNTFTTPENCQYLRFCGLKTELDTAQLLKENQERRVIELCKREIYKDKIYNQDGKWYLHKETGKLVFNGGENWSIQNTGVANYRYRLTVPRDNIKFQDPYPITNKYVRVYISSTNTTQGFNLAYATATTLQLSIRYGEEKTLADFKEELSNNNLKLYHALVEPVDSEITDTELLEQLEAIRLELGVNNITVDSPYLSSPLKLTYYSTENPYVDAIYSQQDKNDLKIWFDNVELVDANRYCESITRVARILPEDGGKRFSLDNFFSTNLTVILHNVDLSIIKDQVRIEIGTDVGNNQYEYIPLGIFNIQDSPEINKNKITLKLRDNRVKFDFNYDAQPLIQSLGGKATKKQILDDICNQAQVENTIDYFDNENDEISIFDNTIQAQTYVSYLMEQAGNIPTINREGKLTKIDLKDLYVWRIPLSFIESWEKGEPYKIQRVVYESGIIKYQTSADESLDTLYLNSANPYIFSDSQVQGILNKLENFEIDSITTKRVLGNPAIDPYDIIEVYNDLDGTNDIVFRTLANTTYKFNGVHRDSFDTQIGKEARTENVSKNTTDSKFRRVFTNIDQLQGQIQLNVTETLNNRALINEQGQEIDALGTTITQSIDNITASVSTIQDELDNGVSLVKTTTVTVNDEGLSVATDTSKTNTTMTTDKFVVRSGGKDLAFLGYDEETNSTKAQMDNLTVNTYLVAGYHRIEKFERNGERRTGHFYIG